VTYAANGLVDFDRVGRMELEGALWGSVGERLMVAGYIEGDTANDNGLWRRVGFGGWFCC
jgi:hypothetical protein